MDVLQFSSHVLCMWLKHQQFLRTSLIIIIHGTQNYLSTLVISLLDVLIIIVHGTHIYLSSLVISLLDVLIIIIHGTHIYLSTLVISLLDVLIIIIHGTHIYQSSLVISLHNVLDVHVLIINICYNTRVHAHVLARICIKLIHIWISFIRL